MAAAAFGHGATVRVLLDMRADMRLKDTAGDTAADHAEYGSHTAVLKLLGGMEQHP